MVERRRTWSDREITLLLNVWKEGFELTYKHCREKLKTLKSDTKMSSTGCGDVVLTWNLTNNIFEKCLTPRPHP